MLSPKWTLRQPLFGEVGLFQRRKTFDYTKEVLIYQVSQKLSGVFGFEHMFLVPSVLGHEANQVYPDIISYVGTLGFWWRRTRHEFVHGIIIL
ncbi:hypothetical protein KC19_VG022900 [Ceratodon purpureus]|uniref:Uncharacterized protein n=1 Tax=Ceratodon purpureus TaxID=3225 RepID=A0A8T0HLL1_CERPU|nr:hypothetical protein KC19_VG022900 [Ceratodon purpureus]